MKNKRLLLGVLILTLVAGMAFIGCPTDDGGDGGGSLPEAKGKLTIENIEGKYEGKYLVVMVYKNMVSDDSELIGLASVSGDFNNPTRKYVKISGGKATAPLYYSTNEATKWSDIKAYDGNDTFPLIYAWIWDDESPDDNGIPIASAAKITTTTFSGGNATVNWNDFVVDD